MEELFDSKPSEKKKRTGQGEVDKREEDKRKVAPGSGKSSDDEKKPKNLASRSASSDENEKLSHSFAKKVRNNEEDLGTNDQNKAKKIKKPQVKQNFAEDHQDSESSENNPKLQELPVKAKIAQKSPNSSEDDQKSLNVPKKPIKKPTEKKEGIKKATKTEENQKKLNSKLSLIEKVENSDQDDERIQDRSSKLDSNNVTEGEILKQLAIISKQNTLKLSGNQENEENSLKKSSDSSKNSQKGKKRTKKEKKVLSDDEGNAIKVSESLKTSEKVNKTQNLESKHTFGDNFPRINQSSNSKPKRSGSNSSKQSSKSSSSDSKEKKINQGNFFTNMLEKAEDLIEANERSPPETPNLASPVKLKEKSKKLKNIKTSDSAVWNTQQDEVAKLKKQLKEYELLIEKQAQEILELKRSQQPNDKKRKISPKSSGFLQKRSDGTFLHKNPELLKKDDYDFWKIQDEVPNAREPQKLEDIAALKDLWILNMESGSQLNNNLNGKKTSGIKANPLTKYESNKSANIRNRFLPKIATKKDLSK